MSYGMNRRKTLHHQRGISLTEVLVTMVILGLGLVTLLKLQSYLISFNMAAQQQSEAVLLSHEKIEKLRDFSQISSQTGVRAFNDINNGSETISRANTTYTLSWTVTDITAPKQKVVTTTISWLDNQNKSQSINLSSVISEHDPSEQGNLVDGAGAGSIQP